MKAKFYITFLAALMAVLGTATAQNLVFSRFILPTGTIEDKGIVLTVSTDDAEQENDEIDTLFDDDIDAGWEGDPEDQNILTCGLRFRNILIPRGAVIDSAFIIITSHEAKTADDVAQLTIWGDASDNAATFTEDALITALPATQAQVNWTVAEEWGLWTTHRTVNIKTIVQELVNRNGWQPGNAMAFIVEGQNQGPSEVENAREFESFENIADPEEGGDGQNHPERVPQLVIYYSAQSVMAEIPVMVTDTITEEDLTFPVSSDDAEQENDEIDSLFDDDLDAGWEGDPEDQNVLNTGIRFRNLPIPMGAVIDSAYITVWSHEAKTAEDVAEVTIFAEATDSAATFTEDALITTRPSTQAQVQWTVAEEWGLWEPYRTPDLKTLVQEVVDREGWRAGNAIAFIFQGRNQGPSEVENAREWESFENIADPEEGGDGQNHPERVPRLTVYYSSPNSTGVFTFAPQAESLKIVPNPAGSHGINIELKDLSPADIRIFDLNGRVMLSKRTRDMQQVAIDTHQLPKGVYVVQAIQNNRLFVEQLIVQ